MKKLLIVALSAAVITACNNEAKQSDAANDTATTTEITAVTEPTVQYAEGDIMKQDGKLVVWTNGQWVAVDKDVTLDNGVIVKANGDVVNKEGKIIVLEDGSRVTKAGNFFDKAGAAIENAWDATKAGVSNAAAATKEGVENAAQATKEGVKDAAQATKETAKDVGQAIKKGAQKVGDKTKEVVEDIKK